MGNLCVDWGFCIPPTEQDRIAQSQVLEAQELACQVIKAEGMVPEYEKKWVRRIKGRFIERFGYSISTQDFRGE